VLSRTDVEYLESALLLPWERRLRRLERRDAAVRLVAASLPAARQTRVAQQLAEVYTRYLSTGWRFESSLAELSDRSALRRGLHALAVANGGRPLGWRQICRILTEENVTNGCGDDNDRRG